MTHKLGAKALQYVESLDLPAPEMTEDPVVLTPPDYFDRTKSQAMVVGSGIVSFVQGVTTEQRQDLINSTLLAQLAAKKQVADPADIYGWYNAYFDVLSNIGWVIQDRGFATYAEDSINFEAHEAILKVAAALLGPATAGLAVVVATLDALKSMNDGPWIALFNRESKSAHAARFQVTLAEPGPHDDFLVTLMAFGLEAESNLTQVLFFKFRSSEATLKHYSGKVSINALILSAVRAALAEKLSRFSTEYIRALPDLD